MQLGMMFTNHSSMSDLPFLNLSMLSARCLLCCASEADDEMSDDFLMTIKSVTARSTREENTLLMNTMIRMMGRLSDYVLTM